MAGQTVTLYERDDPSVELARYDQDDFIKNLVKLLGEERLCWWATIPTALAKGAFAEPEEPEALTLSKAKK